MGYLIAILSGAAMSVQGVFNTEVSKQTSLWVANIMVQLLAFVSCIIIWFLSDRTALVKLLDVSPKYVLTGGIIGAFITFSVMKSMDFMGPAKAVMLIVIAQLLVAYLIELFGLFGVEKVNFEPKKVVGMLLAIIGFVIFKWT